LTWALALLSAALLILAQPGPDLTWLAWIALTPLLIAVAREPRVKRRFLLGWSAGIVYWFVVCIWIQFVLEVHGGMGRWGGWGAFILFSLYKGIHLGVFAALAAPLMPRAYAAPAIAALWVGLERTHGTFAFAWLALGNAGTDMEPLLRLAPWVGVYGLSFVFALVAASIATLRPRQLAYCAIALVVLVLPRMPASPPTSTAVLVQPNMDEEQVWTPEIMERTEQGLIAESLETATREHARLIIWPEAPAPLYFFNDARFRNYATDLARTAQAYFLFGNVSFTPQGGPLNSAVMLSPAGNLIDRYDKMYLVPFGEFVPPPFGFVNRITKEAGDFTAGERIVAFNMDSHRVGTFICYESAFPHLVRRFELAGADLFVNISNDGYFGHSAAREQHLKLVRMRAAENRRWILRATNDGITAVVNPAGRVTQRIPPFKESATAVQYGYETAITFYARHGDWFAWSCLIAGLGLSLTQSLRRNPESGKWSYRS
jgi:apolipoprotein N-acyltransferase